MSRHSRRSLRFEPLEGRDAPSLIFGPGTAPTSPGDASAPTAIHASVSMTGVHDGGGGAGQTAQSSWRWSYDLKQGKTM